MAGGPSPVHSRYHRPPYPAPWEPYRYHSLPLPLDRQLRYQSRPRHNVVRTVGFDTVASMASAAAMPLAVLSLSELLVINLPFPSETGHRLCLPTCFPMVSARGELNLLPNLIPNTYGIYLTYWVALRTKITDADIGSCAPRGTYTRYRK